LPTFAELKESTSLIPPGSRLGGYEIIEPIGAGGMGVVYRACDTRLGRPVAIKALPARCSCDKALLHKFQQEAIALSSINHPNIVTLYALGEPADAYYIVMEFVEGRTLRRQISRDRMKLGAVLDVGTQVAGALSAAHSAGVIHRDIKPENVMIRPDGLVKVLDFGLAKLTQHRDLPHPVESANDISDQETVGLDESQGPYAYMTTPIETWSHTRILGTANYMSPEQLTGEEVDARTDIFSLGVTLYELITGVAPFFGHTSAEVVAAILDREPVALSRYRPEVPRGLEQIIGKALRKDRDRRYQDVRDLLIDLQDTQQEIGSQATIRRQADYEMIDLTNLSDRLAERDVAQILGNHGNPSIALNTTTNSPITLSESVQQDIGEAIALALPAMARLLILFGDNRSLEGDGTERK